MGIVVETVDISNTYTCFSDNCGVHGSAAEFTMMANFVIAQPQADVLPLQMSCSSYTEQELTL